MGEIDQPRTRLAQVLGERYMTVDQFRAEFETVTGMALSERQAYRWIAGDLKTLPYPAAQQGLQSMFGEPAVRLLGPPCGFPVSNTDTRAAVALSAGNGRGAEPTNREGQLITMSAERARNFLSRAEVSNVGPETLDQLTDDVRRVASVYNQKPLTELLGDLVEVQERAFSFLEGHQKLNQTRQLHFLAGVTSGLMAKASHDFGAPHDAMTHARTAFVCADNADHNGLRAFIRGLQSLIAYWAGRPMDAVRFAESGSEAAGRSTGTSSVWLASSEARAWAVLRNVEKANQAIARAMELREGVSLDELDEFGGICTFSRPRQLYYAADALAWVCDEQAQEGERMALEAVSAYDTAPPHERAFSDEAGARTDLAIARISLGELDGAMEALDPVLSLPPAQRINGIVLSVNRVHSALSTVVSDARERSGMQESIESFTRTPMAALPR